MPLSPKLSPKPSAKRSVKPSPGFTLGQLTHSDTALRLGLDNRPPPEHLANLRRLAAMLEAIEGVLGHPLKLTSAYRNPQVNRAVGGVPTSRHALGLAADFVCPGFGPPLEVARAIALSALDIDQVIHEYGRWVHAGLATPGAAARRQHLTICSTEEGYLEGLLPCAPASRASGIQA